MDLNKYFDFSPAQLKFLTVLAVVLVFMTGYYFVRVNSRPTDRGVALPVFLGDKEVYVGPFVLDPNTAPVDSLELLPGIGPVLADRIVAYRQQAAFETEIDITNVTGIGPKVYERIKPYLKVARP